MRNDCLPAFISALIACVAFCLPTSAVTITATPQPAEEARAVVMAQLRALQENDKPDPDAGIRTAWTFAHPDNRRATGPLQRFTKMLKSPAYRDLIDHQAHRVELLEADRDKAAFAVVVFPDGNEAPVRYLWKVAKVDAGERAGEWATTAVSQPTSAGGPPA